jgi:hypothetical protein
MPNGEAIDYVMGNLGAYAPRVLHKGKVPIKKSIAPRYVQ